MVPPKRLQTQTERDEASWAARKEREATPEPVDEDVTGQYSGEALRVMRSRRPTDRRLGRLEEKHDELSEELTKLRIQQGATDSKVDTLLDLATKAESARQEREDRETRADEARVARDDKQRRDARKHTIAMISALGVAIAAVLTAVLHG